MTLSAIKARLHRFRTETDGYATLEVAIMIPILFVLFGAAWVYFDVFRQQTVNQKANYAIGDMVSRETEVLEDEYFDNTFKLLGVLTRNSVLPDELTGLFPADLRITVVSYKEANDKFDVEWSVARGDYPALETQDLNNYTERLPTIANGAELILVETWEDYTPVFRVGLAPLEIRTYSFTHPRYAPQVLYAGAMGENNGWGNGDQDAPGSSLCTNNAENATDCTNEDGSNNVEPNGQSKSKG